MDMFIGFLDYTSDALIGQSVDHDISMLDETVLNALDIHHLDKNQLKMVPLTPLEHMVEEQKKKRKMTSGNIVKRLNPAIGMKMVQEEGRGESQLNTSIPETFEYRKFEDKLNESRPAE